jgi:hypothetical protein
MPGQGDWAETAAGRVAYTRTAHEATAPTPMGPQIVGCLSAQVATDLRTFDRVMIFLGDVLKKWL